MRNILDWTTVSVLVSWIAFRCWAVNTVYVHCHRSPNLVAWTIDGLSAIV